jgi:hypothetical protein
MAAVPWGLVVPFLTDDKMFAYGVEYGLLYARVRHADKGETVKDYVSRENQERVLLMANRLGWSVGKCEPHDECWFWLEMEKA